MAHGTPSLFTGPSAGQASSQAGTAAAGQASSQATASSGSALSQGASSSSGQAFSQGSAQSSAPPAGQPLPQQAPLPGGQAPPQAPSGIPPKATSPQQLPPQPPPAPTKSTSPRHALSGGSAVKTTIIVVTVVVLVAAGAIGAAAHFLSHPQPLISITSNYKVGNTLAGANGTILHLSGQKFSSNSAITFLLDGHVAPGNLGTQSDSNGNFSADITITNAWSVGTHTLTASDASNNSTKNSVSVTIVQPGQANTPGTNGAPPDDATFTLNIPANVRNNTVNQPFTSNEEALHITGHPDPAGGTACLNNDDGRQYSSAYVTTISNTIPFTETYSFSCKGSYKSGKVSYTETLLTDVITFTDGSGISCTLNSPQLNQQVTGSYTGNNTFTGTWTYGPVPSSDFSCSDPNQSFFYSSGNGTWTGTVSGL